MKIKNHLFIAFVLLLLTACSHSTLVEPASEPDVISKQTLFSSGEIESEYRVVNGKIDGTFKSYYQSGETKFVRSYRANQLHGHSKLYNETGVIISDSYYEQDNLVTVTLYDNEGLKYSFYSYANGKQNGPFNVFHKNGNVKMSGNMLNDKLNGEVLINNEKGIRRKQKSYRSGVLNGETSYFDNSGHRLCTVTYSDGIPSGDYYIYQSGMSLADCINYK